MADSPSTPPRVRSPTLKRRASSPSLESKRPRTCEGATDTASLSGNCNTLEVITPLPDPKPNPLATPNIPHSVGCSHTPSEEGEAQKILDGSHDQCSSVPQAPQRSRDDAPSNEEDADSERRDSAIQLARDDTNKSGVSVFRLSYSLTSPNGIPSPVQFPASLGVARVEPATVRRHIRHYFYLEKPKELPRLSPVLPATHFNPTYKDYRTAAGLTIPLPEAYDLFSCVVGEYGHRLTDNHDNIDWPLIKQKTSADEDVAVLQRKYQEHVAPIVALWLQEVMLARTCISLDEEFPAVDGYQISTISGGVVDALEEALRTVARILGHTETWHSLVAESPLKSGIRSSSSEWVTWFLDVAHSGVGRQVFCEVRGKPCRPLLDLLDEAITSMRESVSPERTTLVHLFADFVRNSGDFPTRLWVTPIGLNTDRYPNFLAGGMNAYNGDVGGEARTLCTKLGRSDFNRTPGDKWDEYQQYLRGIAFCSQLRHPNLLPLLGVFSLKRYPEPGFVHPRFSGLERRFPFSLAPLRSDLLMLGIAKALQYIHAHDIIHGDMQWPNIVIDGNNVSVWNFGFYRVYQHETCMPWTYGYTGFHYPKGADGPSKKKDIFSCGLIFLSLGLAAARPADGPTGMHGFTSDIALTGMDEFTSDIGPKLLRAAAHRTPLPAMPTLLTQAYCFGEKGGELVWKLILDMTDPDAALPIDTVVQRLGVITGANCWKCKLSASFPISPTQNEVEYSVMC